MMRSCWSKESSLACSLNCHREPTMLMYNVVVLAPETVSMLAGSRTVV